METKYNAYKLYSNGNRVKNPTITFDVSEYNVEPDGIEIGSFFEEHIRSKLDKKLQKVKFEIIRTDLPQEPKEDTSKIEKEIRDKKIKQYLTILLRKKALKIKQEKVSISLSLNKHTDWKWAWCANELSTNKYITTLTDKFDSWYDADEWISKKIEKIKE